MIIPPLERRNSDECPLGYAYYRCDNNGFSGCCSTTVSCDMEQGGCPAVNLAPRLAQVEDGSIISRSVFPLSSTISQPTQLRTSTSRSLSSISTRRPPTLLPTPPSTPTTSWLITQTPEAPGLPSTTLDDSPTTLSDTSTTSVGNTPIPSATQASAEAGVTKTEFPVAAILTLIIGAVVIVVFLAVWCLRRRYIRGWGERHQNQQGGSEDEQPLDRRRTFESMAAPDEMAAMEEAANRAKVERRSALGGLRHTVTFDNPRGGAFENQGGPVFTNRGSRAVIGNIDSSNGRYSPNSDRSSIAESAMVSPLAMNPIYLHHSSTTPRLISELDGRPVNVELESPTTTTPTSGLYPPPIPRAPDPARTNKAMQVTPSDLEFDVDNILPSTVNGNMRVTASDLEFEIENILPAWSDGTKTPPKTPKAVIPWDTPFSSPLSDRQRASQETPRTKLSPPRLQRSQGVTVTRWSDFD